MMRVRTSCIGRLSQVHAVPTVYDAISAANTSPSDPRARAGGAIRDSRSLAFPPKLFHSSASPHPPICCSPPLRWAPPIITPPPVPAARLGTTRPPPPPATPLSIVWSLPMDLSHPLPDAALFVTPFCDTFVAFARQRERSGAVSGPYFVRRNKERERERKRRRGGDGGGGGGDG